MKILILTLEAGENEFPNCKESVQKSKENFSGTVEHQVFSNLPREKADSTVYRRIEESKNNYDLFIKLDADMCLSDNFFSQLEAFISERPKVSHLVIPVYDSLSAKSIIGLHIFTPNVYWPNLDSKSPIYVDPDPKLVRGQKYVEKRHFKFMIHHCFNPSLSQAYYYGLHRGLKFFEPPEKIRHISRKYLQFSLISAVKKNYLTSEKLTRERGFFLLGFFHSKSLSSNQALKELQNKTDFSEKDASTEALNSFLKERMFWLPNTIVMFAVQLVRVIITKP